MSARARRSGLARLTIGPPWRNPGHAPFGAPSPSFGGRKERAEYGQTPAPDPRPGQHSVGYVVSMTLSAVIPAERSESRDPVNPAAKVSCTAAPHRIVQRLLGPRFPGDDSGESGSLHPHQTPVTHRMS